MITTSDYIVNRLFERYGVRHVFLIPGGGAMYLNDSFGKSKDIEYICNHHEQACAMAAETYARVSGKIGVVNVTSGPGGLNTLTGVQGQWTDSVPVLYLSGQIKQETSVYSDPHLHLRQLGDQEADIIRVVKSITKFAETIRSPKEVKKLLDKAIHIATSGRPGPVWLDVPLDVQGAPLDENELIEYDSAEDDVKTDPAEKCDEVLQLLAGASRPIIVAGHGIRISGAGDEFLRLVGLLKLPVVTTFNGMDLIPSENPYFIGRIGTIGDRAGNFALQNSDLMISIGSRNNIRQVSYFWESYARAAKKVVIDIDENELKKHTIKPDFPLLMDAGSFIRRMLDKVAHYALPYRREWHTWCLERKAKYTTVLREYREEKDRANAYCFIEKLTDLLHEQEIIIAGNGSASVVLFQAAKVKDGQRYICNSGCAAMGYDLPGAIGACIAANKKPIVCISGDGSCMMNLQELETIAYHKLPIKIFLLNNEGYVSMRQTQGAFFNGRMTAVDKDSGVGFPDFRKIARAFGLQTEIIESNFDLESKIIKVLEYPGPILCEVVLPKNYLFSPKLSSKKMPNGKMVSMPLEDLSPFLDRGEFKQNMIIPPLDEAV